MCACVCARAYLVCIQRERDRQTDRQTERERQIDRERTNIGPNLSRSANEPQISAGVRMAKVSSYSTKIGSGTGTNFKKSVH
jgi:hypothetical protein